MLADLWREIAVKSIKLWVWEVTQIRKQLDGLPLGGRQRTADPKMLHEKAAELVAWVEDDDSTFALFVSYMDLEPADARDLLQNEYDYWGVLAAAKKAAA